MKKILLLGGLLLIIELNAYGACLVEDLQKQNTCTGGASSINDSAQIDQNDNKSYYDELKKMYQIPTMSTPYNYNNGFPALNQNCMFGACFPDIR